MKSILTKLGMLCIFLSFQGFSQVVYQNDATRVINDSTHDGTQLIEIKAESSASPLIGKLYIEHWGNYNDQEVELANGGQDNHRIQKSYGTLLISRNIVTSPTNCHKVFEHGYDWYGETANENLYHGSGMTLEIGQEGLIVYTNRHGLTGAEPVSAGILRCSTAGGMTYSQSAAVGIDRPYHMPKLASFSVFPADPINIRGAVVNGISTHGAGQSVLGIFNTSSAASKRGTILFGLGQTIEELWGVDNGNYPTTGSYAEISYYSAATTGSTTLRRGGTLYIMGKDTAGVSIVSECAGKGGIRFANGPRWDSLQWWIRPDGKMYVKRLQQTTTGTKVLVWENNILKYRNLTVMTDGGEEIIATLREENSRLAAEIEELKETQRLMRKDLDMIRDELGKDGTR